MGTGVSFFEECKNTNKKRDTILAASLRNFLRTPHSHLAP